MKFRNIPAFILVLGFVSLMGCAKQADPKRPIEKIQKEVGSMSVAQLESHAAAYAAAIRSQKTEIGKIQQEIQRMPMDKVFNNKAMTVKIADIGRRAEAFFERYRIYVQALQEKGGDLSKARID
jgi:hypothetical protein